jgi:hypothetical protein
MRQSTGKRGFRNGTPDGNRGNMNLFPPGLQLHRRLINGELETSGRETALSRLAPPDFAIIGAPKCGTTTLYEALNSHPGVFMPFMKEPNYFLPKACKLRLVETEYRYHSLYRRARESQLRGEASALYLQSALAIAQIQAVRPDAKFIAILRNPVDMFVSWHNEQVRGLNEDQLDPEQAWGLQEARAEGQSLPPLCEEPEILQYRRICCIGEQTQRLFQQVPERQRLVLLLEDLHLDPHSTLERALRFLGLPEAPSCRLSSANGFSGVRSISLARLNRLAYSNTTLRAIRADLGARVSPWGIRPLKALTCFNRKPAPKPALPSEFSRRLGAAFAADTELLESLLQRRLPHWRFMK